MQSHSSPRNSIPVETLDLIAQLEKERLDLDKDESRQRIAPDEASQIRLSIDRIIGDLEARLGVTET